MSEAKSPFHRGEKEIQSRLEIEETMEELGRRMIRDFMPEQHQEFFSRLPLLIVGTIDSVGRHEIALHTAPTQEAISAHQMSHYQ